MSKAANDRPTPIDPLESAVFGHDREIFRQALTNIRDMSDTGRRFFLARVNAYFTSPESERIEKLLKATSHPPRPAKPLGWGRVGALQGATATLSELLHQNDGDGEGHHTESWEKEVRKAMNELIAVYSERDYEGDGLYDGLVSHTKKDSIQIFSCKKCGYSRSVATGYVVPDCPNCGGILRYDADADAAKCT